MRILEWLRNRYAAVSNGIDRIVLGEADFEKTAGIVPFVYYALFYIAFSRIEGLDYLIAQGAAGFSPRAVLSWTEGFEYATIVNAVYLLWAATALIACIFPLRRSARVLAFVGFWQFHAFTASFGSPNHQWDHWLWVLLILCFLPSIRKDASSSERRIFSLVLWTAQAWLLLTYTMAGAGKLIYAGIQLAHGQSNAFSPDAGALFAATQLNQMHMTVPLSDLLINHPFVAWIPFLIVLEIQTCALVIAFRPKLHRLWGVGLILFHLGTYLTMRAVFTAPSLLLLMLLVASPFAPAKVVWREVLREIPLIGLPFRLMDARRRTS